MSHAIKTDAFRGWVNEVDAPGVADKDLDAVKERVGQLTHQAFNTIFSSFTVYEGYGFHLERLFTDDDMHVQHLALGSKDLAKAASMSAESLGDFGVLARALVEQDAVTIEGKGHEVEAKRLNRKQLLLVYAVAVLWLVAIAGVGVLVGTIK